MRREQNTIRHTRSLGVCLVLLAVLAAGCKGSDAGQQIPPTNTPPTHHTSTERSTGGSPSTPTPSSTPPSTKTAAINLSGQWSGQYGGAFSGTFHLSWQQKGTHLRGTITLSTEPGPLRLTGKVHGTSISFGTVGSSAVTYTGKASADSMSGTYRVGGRAGGSWSASKST